MPQKMIFITLEQQKVLDTQFTLKELKVGCQVIILRSCDFEKT